MGVSRILIFILGIVILSLWLLRGNNKEGYEQSPIYLCTNGCFTTYSNEVNAASDSCAREFPYPDDQQKCLRGSTAYIQSRECMNSCSSNCPVDICNKGCHYLNDQNIAQVALRCDSEYSTDAERQKCLEGSSEYQNGVACMKVCSEGCK